MAGTPDPGNGLHRDRSMDAYAGFEPQVGEIRALRTFRIGPGGVLYPLFNKAPWVDGTNTATCTRPGSDSEATRHPAPASDCRCGFYGYASEAGAAENPYARHVLAVVAYWGHIIAGTRGLRAEQARIEAIWLSGKVPTDLAGMVATRYPSATIYTDKAAMLTSHAPTVLDCYETTVAPETGAFAKIGIWVATAAALIVGLVPAHWLGSNAEARTIWALEFVFFLVAALVLRRRRADMAGKRQAVLCVAIGLWLVAPAFGTIGLLFLRLPLIQVTTMAFAQRVLMARAAGSFPAQVT